MFTNQPATIVDAQIHDDRMRSYDPYLISYHQDTNSFTYSDPWVDIGKNNSNDNNNDKNNNNSNDGCQNNNNQQVNHESSTSYAQEIPIANQNYTHTPEISAASPSQTVLPNNNDTANNNIVVHENQSASHHHHTHCDNNPSPSAVIQNVEYNEHVTEKVSSQMQVSCDGKNIDSHVTYSCCLCRNVIVFLLNLAEFFSFIPHETY